MTQVPPNDHDRPERVPGSHGPRPAYPIESVDNALKLLGMFRRRQLVRVSEAGDALGIARSTAHRLLAMLQYHGFVRQDPLSKAYVAGQALLDLGLAAVQGLDIRTLARPELERLSRELEETAHLVVLEGRAALTIDSVESTRALRVGARTGVADPCHCTAPGKALLAEFAGHELRSLLGDGPLETPTPRAIARLDELERELEQIRELGFAASFEECEPGVSAIAAAIPEPALLPRAAIGISAPSFRLTSKETARVAAAVVEAAHAVVARTGPALGVGETL
ncbi:MAG: IclR family transcriptional regulator [Thermoleophilia bacterium]|nr:IclR family transcriptional regulator [Thermoleophilia bacterium]